MTNTILIWLPLAILAVYLLVRIAIKKDEYSGRRWRADKTSVWRLLITGVVFFIIMYLIFRT